MDLTIWFDVERMTVVIRRRERRQKNYLFLTVSVSFAGTSRLQISAKKESQETLEKGRIRRHESVGRRRRSYAGTSSSRRRCHESRGRRGRRHESGWRQRRRRRSIVATIVGRRQLGL